MKTMKQLLDQFESENAIWKYQMDCLKKQLDENIDNIVREDLNLDKFVYHIDIRSLICKQMSQLDAGYKKFLSKWKKKLHRRLIIESLKRIFKN